MKTKKFDCVEMKHVGAEKIQEQIARMTREQEIRFWKERSQLLKEHQKIIQKQHNKLAA